MTSTVSRETLALLNRFEAMVRGENQRQNLVAPSTLPNLWTRHIGSGAGLPGLVITILSGDPMTLIEPRRLRADFLRRACAELGLMQVTVVESKAERATGRFDVVTARAVAETGKLFAMTEHLAHAGTRYILPKGRSAKKELEAATHSWQGEFRLVPSETNDEAFILVADQVRRKGTR